VISDATLYVGWGPPPPPRDAAEAPRQGEAQFGCGSAAAGRQLHLEQDRDVLDTWFSSASGPFSTLGCPMRRRPIWATW